MAKNSKEPDEILYDGVENATKLGDRLNATDGCETARTGIGWRKFKKCNEILKGKRFSLKIKEKVYKSCV